jgi:hypothetical protein
MLALSLSARILNENANQAIFSLVMVTQFNLYITVNVSSLCEELVYNRVIISVLCKEHIDILDKVKQ